MTQGKKVEFYRHALGETESESLRQALNGTFLSTGPLTNRFEREIADHLGIEHAVGVSSGTMAMTLCLNAWGIGPGDEVIVPAMTFVATANVVEHCGARTVFVDVEGDTGLIDPAKVEAAITERTRAIIAVHLYGHPANMSALREIADRRGIRLLEDSAHCVEGTRSGFKPGAVGDAATLSFYATKNMTCGEGGCILTRDGDLADQVRRLRLHGMDKSASSRYAGRFVHWDVEELGFKANLSDLQAALLLPQIGKLEAQLARREAICAEYERRFRTAAIEFPIVEPAVGSARHLFTVWVAPDRRDQTLLALNERGVGVAVNYRAVHLLSYYRRAYGLKQGDFPIAERIGDSTITLPLYPSLTDDEVEHVVDSVLAVSGN